MDKNTYPYEFGIEDIIIYNEVKRKVINKIYPSGTGIANGYPLNVRDYLAKKNNLVI